MPPITSEATFEQHIENHLLKSHCYHAADQAGYDRVLCLRPDAVISFIRATQTERWREYCERIGSKDTAASNILKRIRDVIDAEGTLHALRRGIDIHGGGHFDLCYFEPTNPAAEDARKLSAENLLHVQRQLKFSSNTEQSLDLAIFLNGLPIFTAELKNPVSGQDVRAAMTQYRETRDPRELLFRFGRCLAHFAVDSELVYVTTELAGAGTVFLPFNQGNDGGAGNPPRKTGYATGYLWEDIWSRPSVLDLIQRFLRVIDVVDDKGRPTKKRRQIFPRFHQLTCVRETVASVREAGAGGKYLNQHSAGSGKTNCIAWLANSLATLHDTKGAPAFGSVVVISDKRVIDRQLQRTLNQVIETKGMLENISSEDGMTSRDLKAALEDGKRIIVTTLQKFGVIADQMSELSSKRFAVVIDEAHSSQSGEAAAAVQRVLSYGSDEEKKDDEDEVSIEDRIAAEMKRRGPQPNVSYFAFTATPKPETLQQFGAKGADGKYRPTSHYSMRQAIEEGFILDVLRNYVTYDQYWGLLKTVDHDPIFDSARAKSLLKQFVSRDERTIARKVAVMVEHFRDVVSGKLSGKAKAMIVTGSRLQAVRYRLAVDEYLKQLGSPWKALVAFTDTVKDPKDGKEYTEAGMNGFPESATADRFEADDCRILIVANKFQTGFDQPKLVAMYVDKKLRGVACVQTLSRLNRTMAGKDETFVLDFENTPEDIESAFQPYYDRTALAKDVDPNQLYDIRTKMEKLGIYEAKDVQDFADIWFGKSPQAARLHAVADRAKARWMQADELEQAEFKSLARDFVKLHAFLSGILPLHDTAFEKLSVFLRFLVCKLPAKGKELPTEVLGMVDMEKLAIRKKDTHTIELKRGEAEQEPLPFGGGAAISEDDRQALSKIIQDLNERFGTSFSEEEVVVIKQLERRIEEDDALRQQLANGSPDGVQATFRQVAEEAFADIIDENFGFYKKVSEDPEVSAEFFGRLFDWFLERRRGKTDRGE
jgi:type I restriction enzyme R subunit